MTHRRVCIIGAGISGLSCGVRLKQLLGSNYEITIKARDFLQETTSDVAAGGFRPYNEPTVDGYNGRRAHPGRDMLILSHERLKTLAKSPEESEIAGVHSDIRGYDLYYPGTLNPHEEPFYTKHLDGTRKLSSFEIQSIFPKLPKGCEGYYTVTYMMSPRTHMPWLTNQFKQADGKIVRASIESFESLFDRYDIVINCTGLSARTLCDDQNIVPSRGQVIRVDTGANAPKTFAYINNGAMKMPYYFWTPDYTVVGGTKLVGDGCTDIRNEDRDMIMNFCDNYFPWLKVTNDSAVQDVVGLRPHRPNVRIERELCTYKGEKRWIVHNYGHGGHGISWSWGAACLVAELVTDVIFQPKL